MQVFLRSGLMWWVLVCFASVAWAQQSAVQLTLDPSELGFQGIVRPGTWTPLRIIVDNATGPTRQVIVSWALKDMDQDTVLAQRKITLTAGRIQHVWLYAVPPLSTKKEDVWTVSVRDELTGQLLVSGPIQMVTRAPPTTSLIACTGSRVRLGLDSIYTEKIHGPENIPYTQHESMHLIRGFSPQLLPDRWYGLSGLNMIIWTPDSLDPGAPSIPPQALLALRQWIMQGGHLVVSMPTVGELWTSSTLADLLPEVNMQVVTDQFPPPSLGLYTDLMKIDLLRLDPKPGSDVAVLARDANSQFPVIVTQQRGFGRVTLVGLDLSSPDLGVLPNGSRFWHAICNWQSPAFRPDEIRRRLNNKTIAPIFSRTAVDIGALVAPQVAMKGTYNTALLIAMLLFAGYWLISGPVSFFFLKYKSRERYAWSVFVFTVILFSIISWATALALRPVATRVEHFSIIDIDPQQQQVRASSWLSLFVAEHADVDVRVQDNPNSTSNQNLIAAPGFPPVQPNSGFLDPQSYHFAANAPGDVKIPFRATAKQLAIEWLANTTDPMPQGYTDKNLIHGKVSLVNRLPVGTLTHNLPKPLKDVLFVYCPGGSRTPLVWRQKEDWQPGTPLTISPTTARDRLIQRPTTPTAHDWDGYLGFLQHGNKPLQRLINANNPDLQLASNEIHTGVEMLTFYDMLPPPAYWEVSNTIGADSPMHFLRSLGRELDWSKLTVFPRLILIGYMEDAPLPVPLLVDQKPVHGRGNVAVRYIIHLDSLSVATNPAGGTEPDTE